MESNTIRVSRSARVWTHGSVMSEERVLALHGYGELAEYHIKNYESVTQRVICPEGLSRLYLSGMSGRVGASWMTKHDRLHEIRDYVNYLDQVQEEFGKITCVSAFSQGCATAWRWILRGNSQYLNRVYLWAGDLPVDEMETSYDGQLDDVKIYFVLGKSDPYISVDQVVKKLELLDKYNLSYELHIHDGAHKIDRSLLKALLDSK